MSNDQKHLISRLDGFIRKYYKDQLIRGILYSVGLLVVLFLGLALSEYFGRFSSPIRTGLFWTYLALTALVLFRYIATPLFKWFRLGPRIDHAQAANIIGQHFAEVKDKLLNTLQLGEQARTQPERREWIEASIAQRSRELGAVPFGQAIDLKKNKRYLRYALPPLLVLLILLVAAPSVIQEGTGRLLQHGREFIPEAPFRFILTNDDLTVPEHEDLVLGLELAGEAIPEQVKLITSLGQVPMVKQDNVHFEHRFRNVQEPISFWFEADGFRSQSYTLNTLPNPLLMNFSMELEYPAYLKRGKDLLNNSGDATVPIGTKISWQMGTRSADRVLLAFDDSTYTLTPQAQNAFLATRRFLSGHAYTLTPANDQMTARDPLKYRIEVVPDLYPTIQAEQRSDSTVTRLLVFSGTIDDDHGFKALEFHYRFVAGGDSIAEDLRSGVRKLTFNPDQTRQQFFTSWDIRQLPLSPGDRIEHWFEVWDNDGVNGSKSARTRIQTYAAPTREELSELQEQSADAMKASMQQGIQEAKELQKELDKLRRDMIDKKELNWQDKQKLQDALERQKKLEQRIDKLGQQLQQSHQQQREFKQLDEQLLDKQEQLQKLFDDVLTDEMKELYRQVQELMEKLDKDKLQEQLQQMEMSQEDIRKELDRSLELFKQLEVEQAAQDITERLEELAKEQEELSEATKEEKLSKEELEQAQEALNKEFEELRKDMDELEKKNSELEDPMDLPKTDEQEESIEQEMQESSEQLEKEQNKKASDKQKSAAEKMEQMAFQMQSAMNSGQQEQQEEDLDALRQLLENIVQLSFDQEKVMDALGGLDKRDPRFVDVGRDQKALRDDARMIEDSLFALSKRVPQLQSVVNREMNAVNNNMDQAIEQISEARANDRVKSAAAEKQQRAMTSLNNLALLLDEALQQMMQQMASSMPGSGQCDKPGGAGKGKPSSAKMRAMQEQMGKQLQKMKEAMEKGNSPGKKGEGGGSPGMSQQLAQMAAQQAAIRKELQKLAQELNKDGSGSGNGLNKLAEEIEQQEKDIVNKKLDQKTVERQKDIMTRLLEHEKAMREREFDEQRTSKEGKQDLGEDPARYFEYQQQKERESELLRTVPPALKPYYKQRVNDYFGTFDQP